MINILKPNFFSTKKQRFKNHENFFFELFENPQHDWIKSDRYIKANFEEVFSLIPLKVLRELYGSSDIWFIPSSGKYSCAIQPIGCSIILIFPEFVKMLRSFNSDNAKAILAHELGHIFYKHSERRIDILEAQVEADRFAIEMGFEKEIEYFIQDLPETLEKRVRLSYITSKHFESY